MSRSFFDISKNQQPSQLSEFKSETNPKINLQNLNPRKDKVVFSSPNIEITKNKIEKNNGTNYQGFRDYHSYHRSMIQRHDNLNKKRAHRRYRELNARSRVHKTPSSKEAIFNTISSTKATSNHQINKFDHSSLSIS